MLGRIICLFFLIGYPNAHGKSELPESPNCGHQIVDSGMELRATAREGEFPWTVQLKYEGKSPYRCVGSLINDRYVLTSAVCVTTKNQLPTGALLGVHVLGEGEHSEEFGIERLIPYESFRTGSNNFDDDIALIKLNDTVKYSDYIKPICLPAKGESLVQPEDKVIMTGWGRDVDNQEVKTKKVVIRRVITNEACELQFSKHNVHIGEGFICTDGLKGYKDYICSGNAGAPIVAKSGGTWYQEGIVSIGSKCGVDFPDANTRVSKYVTWINKQLAQSTD
uniref:Peptidase S1 domain-containing protein n=1 Tax=Photinus pyralis TaxID=7054 RepID=A0A1Y1M969_PHOPY